MKFRSKYSKAIYIVRPTTRTVDQLGVVQIRPGLRAIFDRDTHEFDSRRAQESYRWSDEERQAVEKHLLTDRSYGNGLILMPNQEIPEELGVQPRISESAQAKCEWVALVDGSVEGCDEPALPGGNRCVKHAEKQGKVIKGMLTA